VSVMREKSLYI